MLLLNEIPTKTLGLESWQDGYKALFTTTVLWIPESFGDFGVSYQDFPKHTPEFLKDKDPVLPPVVE